MKYLSLIISVLVGLALLASIAVSDAGDVTLPGISDIPVPVQAAMNARRIAAKQALKNYYRALMDADRAEITRLRTYQNWVMRNHGDNAALAASVAIGEVKKQFRKDLDLFQNRSPIPAKHKIEGLYFYKINGPLSNSSRKVILESDHYISLGGDSFECGWKLVNNRSLAFINSGGRVVVRFKIIRPGFWVGACKEKNYTCSLVRLHNSNLNNGSDLQK